MVCIKSTAKIGDILNLSAIPSRGPAGVSYTIKFMKQVGNGSPVVLNTQNSTGTSVNYQYVIVNTDGNTVQFWAEGTYVCPTDNSVKSGTSDKCVVTITEIPPPTGRKFIVQFDVSVTRDDIKGNYTAEQVNNIMNEVLSKI